MSGIFDSLPAAGGRNLPSLAQSLAPDTVAALITSEIAPLVAKDAELSNECRRFIAAHPKIETDELDEQVTDLLARCQRFTSDSGAIESARVAFKAPVLAAAQSIDRAFKGIGAELVARSVKQRRAPFNLIETIIEALAAHKARQARARADAAAAEAEQRRRDAEALEEAARAGSPAVTFADVAAAYDAADKVQAVADAKPADLTRTRGHRDFGTSSLKKVRVVTIVNPAEVDRIYCVPDAALLQRAAGKAGDPMPTLKGCTIADVDDLTVRR